MTASERTDPGAATTTGASREEKIARARELRAEGMSYRAIGGVLGVTHACVSKWLNPERTREWERTQNAKRHTAKLAWQRAHDHSPEGRGTCSDCGGLLGAGGAAKGTTRCAACVTRRKVENWERVEAMWAEGHKMPEIASAVGWTINHLRAQMARMRKAGRNLPHRYNVTPAVETSPDGCIVWLRYRDKDGYGRTHSHGRSYLAHRLFWEERHGPIPEGLTLDHLCRNRACVNPDHLEPVTRAENVRRGIEARKSEVAA